MTLFASQRRPLWLDGCAADGDGSYLVRSPETREIVGEVALAGPAAAEEAVRSVQRGAAELRGWPRHRRRDLCQRIGTAIGEHRDELTELIRGETAKPVALAAAEVLRAELCFQLAAEESTRATLGEPLAADISPASEAYVLRVERFARGAVLGISPFNFPLNLAAHKVAPALAAGCSILLKAPPQAPSAALALAQLATRAGAPPGAVNVVAAPVSVADGLVADERFGLVSFTGSAQVGWHVQARAGRKPVVLELGGNAAALVCADAELDWAVERACLGAFAFAGQVCISLQRLLVHRSLVRPFTERFIAAVEAVSKPPRWGDSRDASCLGSSLIDDAAAQRILGWIDEARWAGADVVIGGTAVDGRHSLILPTVVLGAPHAARIVAEEVFGPVVVIEPFDDLGEAIDQVNASPYGLQAAVFTRNQATVERAYRTLDVGGVVVNDHPMVRIDNMPYGGNKGSGMGREGLRAAIVAMTEPRVLVQRV